MTSKARTVEAGELSDRAALKLSRAEQQVDRDDMDTVTREEVQDNENADYKSHHTLESDEEEEEKYKRLDMKKVEGQEDATVEYDGEVKITPFNMKDELGEGHFDNTGNFIFDKKKEDIADAWLDNIDWSMVKKKAGSRFEVCQAWGFHRKKTPRRHYCCTFCVSQGSAQEDPDAPGPGIADDDEEEFDAAEQRAAEKRKLNLNRREIYTSLLEFLVKPNESVTKALKRLGGGLSAQELRKQRWSKKKEKGKGTAEDKEKKPDEPATDVTRLTSLVDELVAAGEYDAYSFTKEKLLFELEQMDKAEAGGLDAQDDVEEDMFSDEPMQPAPSEPQIVQDAPSVTPIRGCQKRAGSTSSAPGDGTPTPLKKVRFDVPIGSDESQPEDEESGENGDGKSSEEGQNGLEQQQVNQDKDKNETSASTSGTTDEDDGDVQWEFKWTQDDGAPVYGPFTSKQMLEWQEADYFKQGVYVRKRDANNAGAQFYSIARIDFDLYID